MALWEYLGAGSGVTKGLYHLNGNANDSSWNWNNGTATNVSWVAGRLWSQCASFVWGANPTSHIDYGDILNLTTGLTFSLWFNANSASGVQIIGGKWFNGSVAFQPYIFYVNGTSLVGRITTWGGTALTDITATSAVASWVWSHAVLTYDWSNMYLYVNWSQRATSAKTWNLNTWTRFVLGCQYNISTWTYWDWFAWRIDECIVENRAWTASEIRKQYTCQKWRLAII